MGWPKGEIRLTVGTLGLRRDIRGPGRSCGPGWRDTSGQRERRQRENFTRVDPRSIPRWLRLFTYLASYGAGLAIYSRTVLPPDSLRAARSSAAWSGTTSCGRCCRLANRATTTTHRTSGSQHSSRPRSSGPSPPRALHPNKAEQRPGAEPGPASRAQQGRPRCRDWLRPLADRARLVPGCYLVLLSAQGRGTAWSSAVERVHRFRSIMVEGAAIGWVGPPLTIAVPTATNSMILPCVARSLSQARS